MQRESVARVWPGKEIEHGPWGGVEIERGEWQGHLYRGRYIPCPPSGLRERAACRGCCQTPRRSAPPSRCPVPAAARPRHVLIHRPARPDRAPGSHLRPRRPTGNPRSGWERRGGGVMYQHGIAVCNECAGARMCMCAHVCSCSRLAVSTRNNQVEAGWRQDQDRFESRLGWGGARMAPGFCKGRARLIWHTRRRAAHLGLSRLL